MTLACLMTGCPDTSASSDAAGDSIADADVANDLGDAGLDAMPDGPAPMDALDDLGDASDAADTMDATEVSPPGCVPGMSIACACIDGRMGAQVCLADHTYGPCQCAMADGGMPSDVVLPPLGARLIAPQSVSRVTSRRPTMRWVLPDGVTRARVELCADRPCTRMIMQQEVTGTSWRPTAMLAAGVTYWRVRGLDGDGGVAWSSATWEFVVGQRDAPVDTSFGTIKDFNGDGYDDIAVAENGAFSGMDVFEGRASMGPTTPTYRISLSPDPVYDYAAGDFNGDGLADLALAISETRTEVQVRYGSRTGLPSEPDRVLLQTEGRIFASSLAVGDVNGDGFSDVVTVSQRPPRSSPYYYDWQIYLGGERGIETAPAANVAAPDDYASTGGSVHEFEMAGDVNGDGYADLLTSFPFDPESDGVRRGRAWVVLGHATSPMQRAVRIMPPTSTLNFGHSPSGIGDVNGDGVADFAVSSLNEVSVYLGMEGSVSARPVRTIPSPDGRCWWEADGFGWVIGRAGDYNGDGYADLTVGAPCLPYPGPLGDFREGLGSAYVYPGEAAGVSSMPRVFRGMYVGGRFGGGLGGIGDFNGDGFGDLAILQLTGFDPKGRPERGAALNLLLGSAGGASLSVRWIYPGTENNFAADIAWLGHTTQPGGA